MRLATLLLAVLTFTGCTLVDRRTFAPAPEAQAKPPVTAPAAPEDKRTALVTIEFSVPAPSYEELLRAAVRAAQSRDPYVHFDVVAVVQNTADAETGVQRATGVMRSILRSGVPNDRVHLLLRSDPTLAADQVRVYVR
jgi:uncharacterized SAM-binding protein YcdF (DUF218 family)